MRSRIIVLSALLAAAGTARAAPGVKVDAASVCRDVGIFATTTTPQAVRAQQAASRRKVGANVKELKTIHDKLGALTKENAKLAKRYNALSEERDTRSPKPSEKRQAAILKEMGSIEDKQAALRKTKANLTTRYDAIWKENYGAVPGRGLIWRSDQLGHCANLMEREASQDH